MKKSFHFLALTIATNLLMSQAGAKWSTGLNIIGSGEAFGTSNNFPILFYANNGLKMTLGTNGVLNLNSFSGIGNRVLLTDANGNLYALPQGASGQFCKAMAHGEFTKWCRQLDRSGRSQLYNTNNVKVGIGTSNPLYLLDVNGDVRVKKNLYVEGQILITDRLESGTVRTDTMRANTGSVIIDDTRITNKFEVGGNSKFGGNLAIGTLAGIGDDPSMWMLEEI